MIEIKGTAEEIKRIKEVLWMSTDCPIHNDSSDCETGGCGFHRDEDGNIDLFYECIEKNISFKEVSA